MSGAQGQGMASRFRNVKDYVAFFHAFLYLTLFCIMAIVLEQMRKWRIWETS
jgi:hypothetical protein